MKLWKLKIVISGKYALPECLVEAEDMEKAELLGRRLVGTTLTAVEMKDYQEKRDGISMCKYDHTMSLAQLYEMVVVTAERVVSVSEVREADREYQGKA